MKLRDLRDALGRTAIGIAFALCVLLLMVWDEPLARGVVQTASGDNWPPAVFALGFLALIGFIAWFVTRD